MASKQPPRSAHKRPETSGGYIAVGRVRRPHGLRGEIVVEPLTDFPQRFEPGAVLWAGGRSYHVYGSRSHRGALLLELRSVQSREAADALRGLLLEVPEAELPALEEDQYYRYQLVGLDVVDGSGKRLGRVEEVLDTGANDVYLVRGDEGELLLPAIDAVIKEIDVPGGRMVVELIPGMEYKPPKERKGRQSSGRAGASSG